MTFIRRMVLEERETFQFIGNGEQPPTTAAELSSEVRREPITGLSRIAKCPKIRGYKWGYRGIA
jgi:hypothetical protein